MNLTSVSFETDKPVFIGLDVHRTFFVATCLCDGVVAKRCRLPGTSEAVLHFIGKYFPQAKVFTCYEAGYSGFWLHRDLEAAGIKNLVINPGSLAVARNDKVKTDKRDSLKMATQLAAGQLKGIRVPTPEDERARLIARTREQIARAKRRAQCQIRMRFHQFNLFPLHIERVITVQDVKDILGKLKDDELKSSLQLLLGQWRFLARQLKGLDKQIRQQAESNPLEVTYRSVPGIGPLLARVLAYELGDMSQFKNERVLFSYTGLTPGEYTTGGEIHRGHISRQGNPRLRHLLVEAAWKAVRKDPVLKEDFERISLKSGKKRAIVAIARRLVGRIRAALKAHVLFVVGHRKEVQSTSILQ